MMAETPERQETTVFAVPPANAGAAEAAPTRARSLAHDDPDYIGPFRILEKIGEGGMGVVYKAEQCEPVRRLVALKVIKLGMDTRQVVARFEAERQALAMLSHPNVAQVFEAGMTGSGRPFFAMEYVAGVPLTQYCNQNKLTTRQRLELFIPVCQAVQHAHQKGIIHRDLKPSNILVTFMDGKPAPKVIDFGIAKATNQALTQHTLFTQTGALIGTPDYMSPEQAMGGLDVDTRTDIYSLGVILYQLLTGSLPLDPTSLREAGIEGMARLINTFEPPKPSTRLAMRTTVSGETPGSNRKTRLLQREFRADLDWIVLKAMEKDRSRRYETANGLMLDLQRHLADEPVSARPPSALYRAQKFGRKHRIGVLAGGSILVALLVGLVLATMGLRQARRERSAAVFAQGQALEQKRVADQQTQLAISAQKSAELRLAESLLSQADALSLVGRYAEARLRYGEAYDGFAAAHAPMTAAELGLWSAYRQCSFPLLTFSGHIDRVVSIAISPDGRRILGGGEHGAVRVWEMRTGRELLALAGHKYPVGFVRFLPGGQSALSADLSGAFKLWDLAGGKELRTIEPSKWGATAFDVSADGRTMISSDNDAILHLWDLASGRELLTFHKGHTELVFAIALAPDGRRALSGSYDKTLRLWDLASGESLRTFTGHSDRVESVGLSPDGQVAISGCRDGTVKVWDVVTGKDLRTLREYTKGVFQIAFMPDGHRALTGSREGTLKLWDVATGRELRTFAGPGDATSCMAVGQDGTTAVSATFNGTVHVWDLAERAELRTFRGHVGEVVGVAIAPDGRTAVSGSSDTYLMLWDLATGKQLRSIPAGPYTVKDIALSPDGRYVLNAGYGLRLWDLATGSPSQTYVQGAWESTKVAISPTSRTAFAGFADGRLLFWDLDAVPSTPPFAPEERKPVTALAFTPDGRTAFSGTKENPFQSKSGKIMVWDVASRKRLRSFSLNGDVTSIASDGRTVLSGDSDGMLRVWDLRSGAELRSFNWYAQRSTCMAASPDGQLAIAGSSEGTLLLWDLVHMREFRSFTGHESIRCVALGPSGQFAVSGSSDKTLKLWDFTRGLVQRALEPGVTAAQARLQRSPDDPAALATMGEWYAFRGMDAWAIEFLLRAREGGAAVAPLTLARCYWRLNRNEEARREFQIALGQSQDAAERTYLQRCLDATHDELRGRQP